MSKFIFSKEKYLDYYNMTEATMPKHLKQFLNDCDGKEVDTTFSVYDAKWGFNVYGVNGANWSIPVERLNNYCVEVQNA